MSYLRVISVSLFDSTLWNAFCYSFGALDVSCPVIRYTFPPAPGSYLGMLLLRARFDCTHLRAKLLQHWRPQSELSSDVILFFQVNNTPVAKVKTKDQSKRVALEPRFHRSCSSERVSSSQSNVMSDSPCDCTSTNRPSSKYGVYNLSSASSDSHKATKGSTHGEARLSRTFSFSGTSHADEHAGSNAGIGSLRHASDIECRASVYDNVPSCSVSPSDASMEQGTVHTQDCAGYPQNDTVFDDPSRSRHLLSRTESEDDLSSISSQEEDDDIENADSSGGVFNVKSKGKVMGSVDSGVPSSPVLRSPRYAVCSLFYFVIRSICLFWLF